MSENRWPRNLRPQNGAGSWDVMCYLLINALFVPRLFVSVWPPRSSRKVANRFKRHCLSPSASTAQAFRSVSLLRSMSSSICRIASGEGLLMPLSHRLTIEKMTPTLAANCSWVRPSLERKSLIFLAKSFSSVFGIAFFPALIVYYRPVSKAISNNMNMAYNRRIIYAGYPACQALFNVHLIPPPTLSDGLR